MNKKGKTSIQLFVSQKVYELRINLNLTQEQFAERINCSRSFYADRENLNSADAFNLDAINKIANEFNISPQYFIPPKAL